jgi:hypothetical protein
MSGILVLSGAFQRQLGAIRCVSWSQTSFKWKKEDTLEQVQIDIQQHATECRAMIGALCRLRQYNSVHGALVFFSMMLGKQGLKLVVLMMYCTAVGIVWCLLWSSLMLIVEKSDAHRRAAWCPWWSSTYTENVRGEVVVDRTRRLFWSLLSSSVLDDHQSAITLSCLGWWLYMSSFFIDRDVSEELGSKDEWYPIKPEDQFQELFGQWVNRLCQGTCHSVIRQCTTNKAASAAIKITYTAEAVLEILHHWDNFNIISVQENGKVKALQIRDRRTLV